MKKFIHLFLSLTMLLFCGTLFSQGHLVISEIHVSPTDAEFVEIYNPTSNTIDLTNYYLTDNIQDQSADYVNIVDSTDTKSGNDSDFMAQFPAGSDIGPGEYIVIAMNDSFSTEHGFDPDYEMTPRGVADGDTIPNMLNAGASGIGSFQAKLSNSGEVVILFWWDGVSDLVSDVDIGLWGDKNEGVDKTSVKKDSKTDADSDSTEYLADTPIASQSVIASGSPTFGNSWQRTDPTMEVGETSSGGNGIVGHDETSEDFDTAFTQATPTPGEMLTTSVENRDDAVPNTFALKQNYPNPFNPVTTIQYKVAKTDHVKIQIYNLMGQVVKTLVDQKQNQGDYTIVWHGDNNLGLPVSTGVYFLQMKATNFTKLLKMTLLR